MTKYQGDVQKFKKFIRTWLTKRGDDFHEKNEYNQDAYKNALNSKLPKSYADFYFAMTSFECENILKIEADDEDSSIQLININDVIGNYSKHHELIKAPAVFNEKNYRIYSKDQEEISPFISLDDYNKLLLVGEHNDTVFQGKILLNNFVKFDDEEFEAIFLEIGGAYEVRFSSFAELVVWFYLNDPASEVELDSLYGDHLDDSSKISNILF